MTEPIPGPKGHLLVGNILDIDPVDAVVSLGRIAHEHGPVFQLSLAGSKKIFIASRDLLDELSDETRFTKLVSGPLLQLRNVCADSLFTAHSDEPNWAIAHSVLMPAFGPLAVRGMFDEMYDLASQLVMKWARFGPQNVIDVSSDFTRLTLDTIALCSMSTRFNSFYHDEMNPFVDSMLEVLAESGKRAVRPPVVNDYVMRGSTRQYETNIQKMRGIAASVLAERRASGSKKRDLLGAMLYGRDPKTGAGLSDESILNNMIVFLIAGHETTSGLLSFLFYYFLTRPDVFEKAQREIDEVIGSGPVTVQHMSKLPYLEACLRETLRLHPTAPVISFKPTGDAAKAGTTIGGGKYKVEKDQGVVALLIEVQRDPTVWGADADEFRAERMLDENFSKLPSNSWKPFGNGIRGCIGRAFAWQESLLITAMLLQKFNFRLDDPAYKLKIKQTLTIKPQDFFIHATLRRSDDNQIIEPTMLSDSQMHSDIMSTTSSGSTGATTPTSASASLDLKPLNILFGSNSGTCETMAHSLARKAKSRGFAASVAYLDSQVEKLRTDRPLVIICSSYNGRPPANAVNTVKWLESQPDSGALQGLSYTVYGCGNKDYVSTYHRIPKLLDANLSRLGASRIADIGLGDVTVGNIAEEFETWQDELLWPALSPADDISNEDEIQITIDTKSRASHLGQPNNSEMVVLSNRLLTAPDEPVKRLMEVQLPSGVTYETGDHLAVLPVNDWRLVRRALRWAKLPWDATLSIPTADSTSLPATTSMSVKDILSGYVELSQPATRKNIKKIADSVPCPFMRENVLALEKFLDEKPDEKPNTKNSPWKKSVLDILEEFPASSITFSQFLNMLPPMRPRQYSIASTPLADPSKVALLWTVVESPDAQSSDKHAIGVSSNYLASLVEGDTINASVKPRLHLFHPPEDLSTPVIMVCAGTGLAPFAAFISERAVQAKSGHTLGPAYLFFGHRHPDKDALLQKELLQWEEDGVVRLLHAFSQAPEQSQGSRYVQDRLLEEKELLKETLVDGPGMMYVCGGSEMGASVENTVKRIYMELQGNKDAAMAARWMDELKSSRYVSELFS